MTHPLPDVLTARRTVLRAAGALGLAVPAASVLAACATGGAAPAAETGEITSVNPLGVEGSAPLDVVVFKGGYGDDYAKFHESLYTKRFPDAKITHSGITEIQTELQPRFVGGNPPDVIDNSGAKAMPLGTLVAENQLTELTELLAAPSLDDPARTIADTIIPGSLDAVTFDGKVMALPYVYTARGFWYSKSLFAKHGWTWPTTWDGLVTLAGQMKKAGLAPFTYGGTKAPDYFLYPLFSLAIKHAGGDVLKAIDNLEPNAWRSDAITRAAEAIAELAKAGHFLSGSEGLDHTQAQTAWVQGKAGIYASGSWIENEMKSITPPGFDMVFGAVPPFATDGKLPMTALLASASENFVVPAKAHNQRGGLEYLRVMLSREAAARFSELTKAPTVVKGATGDKDFGSAAFGSVNKAIADAGADIFAYRYASWYADLGAAVKSELANLLAGRVDAAGFVAKAQAKADAIAADTSIKKFKR